MVTLMVMVICIQIKTNRQHMFSARLSMILLLWLIETVSLQNLLVSMNKLGEDKAPYCGGPMGQWVPKHGILKFVVGAVFLTKLALWMDHC
jgi:hypothetical protein